MSEQVFGCRRSTKASSLLHHHPTIHPSIPKRAFTCLPGCTTMYPGVRVPDTVSCPYLLCRAAALPLWDRIHAQIIHSVKSQFTCTPPTMRTCKRPKSVRDLRGRAQFGKCMENGESEMSSRSVKSHSLWPESSTGGASSDPLMKHSDSPDRTFVMQDF